MADVVNVPEDASAAVDLFRLTGPGSAAERLAS